MVADTQQVGGRCHAFDHDRMHAHGNCYQTIFTPTVANFCGVLNLMTVRVFTKITKILAPHKNYPLYGIMPANSIMQGQSLLELAGSDHVSD